MKATNSSTLSSHDAAAAPACPRASAAWFSVPAMT